MTLIFLLKFLGGFERITRRVARVSREISGKNWGPRVIFNSLIEIGSIKLGFCPWLAISDSGVARNFVFVAQTPVRDRDIFLTAGTRV